MRNESFVHQWKEAIIGRETAIAWRPEEKRGGRKVGKEGAKNRLNLEADVEREVKKFEGYGFSGEVEGSCSEQPPGKGRREGKKEEGENERMEATVGENEVHMEDGRFLKRNVDGRNSNMAKEEKEERKGGRRKRRRVRRR